MQASAPVVVTVHALMLCLVGELCCNCVAPTGVAVFATYTCLHILFPTAYRLHKFVLFELSSFL